jgi:uncharacterized protein YndB with AHSA1/START domain
MAEDIAVSTTIQAPAAQVYEMLADLTRMGEWSPETHRVKWLGGDSAPRPGAKFRGYNRIGPIRWFTTGTVVTAEPPKELTWDVTSNGLAVARWSYRVQADGADTCTVTESFTDKRGAIMKIIGLTTSVTDRHEHNKKGMEETLRRLKTAAERNAA